jgi:1,2-dihydroxy-3-keto-5-methylthiopentene dioxygenase
MAYVTIQSSKKTLSDQQEISAFLAYHGVTHQRWDVPKDLAPFQQKDLLDPEEKATVLAAYKPQLDDLKVKGGYIQNDMVCLCPATPNIDTLLKKFDRDHYHTEDEVRFILGGRGIFGFEGKAREKFTIEVTAGDFITIPAYNWHWFNLGESRDIKAIRLFQDMSGWTPTYRQHPDEPAPVIAKTA